MTLFKNERIALIEKSVRVPDVNPIKHPWDKLSGRVSLMSHPSENVQNPTNPISRMAGHAVT